MSKWIIGIVGVVGVLIIISGVMMIRAPQTAGAPAGEAGVTESVTLTAVTENVSPTAGVTENVSPLRALGTSEKIVGTTWSVFDSWGEIIGWLLGGLVSLLLLVVASTCSWVLINSMKDWEVARWFLFGLLFFGVMACLALVSEGEWRGHYTFLCAMGFIFGLLAARAHGPEVAVIALVVLGSAIYGGHLKKIMKEGGSRVRTFVDEVQWTTPRPSLPEAPDLTVPPPEPAVAPTGITTFMYKSKEVFYVYGKALPPQEEGLVSMPMAYEVLGNHGNTNIVVAREVTKGPREGSGGMIYFQRTKRGLRCIWYTKTPKKFCCGWDDTWDGGVAFLDERREVDGVTPILVGKGYELFEKEEYVLDPVELFNKYGSLSENTILKEYSMKVKGLKYVS